MFYLLHSCSEEATSQIYSKFGRNLVFSQHEVLMPSFNQEEFVGLICKPLKAVA